MSSHAGAWRPGLRLTLIERLKTSPLRYLAASRIALLGGPARNAGDGPHGGACGSTRPADEGAYGAEEDHNVQFEGHVLEVVEVVLQLPAGILD